MFCERVGCCIDTSFLSPFFFRFVSASCALLASVDAVYMCMIARDMSMHAMMTGMAEFNSNALFESTFGGGCRGLLVPSPHGGNVRTGEKFGSAGGGESLPRRQNSSGVAAEAAGVAAGAHRTKAGTSRGGSVDVRGSTSGSE